MDFNPFGKVTDSLLYSWDELTEGSLIVEDLYNSFKSNKLELRLVETDIGVNTHQYSMYSQPIDFLHLTSINSNDIESLVTIINKVGLIKLNF